MKHKKIIILGICLLCLVSCSTTKPEKSEESINQKEIESIELEKVNNEKNVDTKSKYIIKNEDEISILIDALNKAEKINGIVDTIEPQYEIKIKRNHYYIWLNSNNTATIMNSKETEILYKISDAKELKTLIRHYFIVVAKNKQ